MEKLSDQEYDKRRLKELRKQKEKGTLDENMKPYLKWLEKRYSL